MNTDRVLETLEYALECEWEAEDSNELPQELRDPLAMLERGRQLLRHGLSVPVFVAETPLDDREYRAAARNGKPIPDQVLIRMHEERDKAEHEVSDN
jgi:hypothetical protein